MTYYAQILWRQQCCQKTAFFIRTLVAHWTNLKQIYKIYYNTRGEKICNVEKFLNMTNVENSEITSYSTFLHYQTNKVYNFDVLLHFTLFCSNLRAFAWRKLTPKLCMWRKITGLLMFRSAKSSSPVVIHHNQWVMCRPFLIRWHGREKCPKKCPQKSVPKKCPKVSLKK